MVKCRMDSICFDCRLIIEDDVLSHAGMSRMFVLSVMERSGCGSFSSSAPRWPVVTKSAYFAQCWGSRKGIRRVRDEE